MSSLHLHAREGKGREGKGRGGKGRKGKEREEKGGKGREGKGRKGSGGSVEGGRAAKQIIHRPTTIIMPYREFLTLPLVNRASIGMH